MPQHAAQYIFIPPIRLALHVEKKNDAEHVETLYVHKSRNGGEKVIILKSDYHEKDIGSTMSNQLEE